MKAISFILIAVLIAGCAGSKKAGDERSKAVVFVTVKNKLQSSAGIYWSDSGGFPKYLGRIRAGQIKKFVIEDSFLHSRLQLMARPNFGATVIARIPEKITSGGMVSWEVSRHSMTWKISKR